MDTIASVPVEVSLAAMSPALYRGSRPLSCLRPRCLPADGGARSACPDRRRRPNRSTRWITNLSVVDDVLDRPSHGVASRTDGRLGRRRLCRAPGHRPLAWPGWIGRSPSLRRSFFSISRSGRSMSLPHRFRPLQLRLHAFPRRHRLRCDDSASLPSNRDCPVNALESRLCYRHLARPLPPFWPLR